MKEVGIILGSDSDIPKIKGCFELLNEFTIDFEVVVLSAHRTPEETKEWAATASERGLKVVIAAAGGAAHLPGVVASYTDLPVIGIPIKTDISGGLDSILSILQMPGGIPVATMPAGKAGGKNAALFAARILALSNPDYAHTYKTYKEKMKTAIKEKNRILEKEGYKKFITP